MIKPNKKEVTSQYDIMNLPQNNIPKKEIFFVNIIAQEAKKKQAAVKFTLRKGKGTAN